jgi:diaminopimelate epimerase
VLSILPSTLAPLAMHVTNPDGSVAEMCGNGLRCVVRWAIDEGVLPPAGGLVETGRGVLACSVEPDGEVRVDMGRPLLAPREIPMVAAGERVLDVPLDLGAEQLRVTAVSMGNPHAVAFIDDDRSLEELARALGPRVEHHPLFPHRTNAEFARFTAPDAIDLVVWERGAALTLACGTGACATVVAAGLLGRSRFGDLVRVRLPGGVLRVQVDPDGSRVWMTGPAVHVFDGVFG